MDRADYEWRYYIGGDCGLKHKKTSKPIGYIFHKEQGVYEAVLVRNVSWDGLIEDLLTVLLIPNNAKKQTQETFTKMGEILKIQETEMQLQLTEARDMLFAHLPRDFVSVPDPLPKKRTHVQLCIRKK